MRLYPDELNCLKSLYDGPYDHIEVDGEPMLKNKCGWSWPVPWELFGLLLCLGLLQSGGSFHGKRVYLLSESGMRERALRF